MAIFGLFGGQNKGDLERGLEKTKESVIKRISRAVMGKSTIDDEVLDNLEEALISSDVGVNTTLRIIERLQARVQRDKFMSTSELNRILREEIAAMLGEDNPDQVTGNGSNQIPGPFVIMVVGVNGVGKTTTIGKLAYLYKKENKKVLLGAADTFRAAAVDQLSIWAERVGVPVIKQQMGSDPASVAFDTVTSAKSGNADVVIIDTAGRLHNKTNLMSELSKIKRVIQKVIPEAPHQILLVLDGSTGQNAFEQARMFTEVTQVNALAITKLDGTAKGGMIFNIAKTLKIPIRFIGVGEAIDDLRPFEAALLVDALFANEDK